MQRWASGLVAAFALAACLAAVGWQIENGIRFSFLFASAVFAALCIHWLMEQFDLVHAELSGHLNDDGLPAERAKYSLYGGYQALTGPLRLHAFGDQTPRYINSRAD